MRRLVVLCASLSLAAVPAVIGLAGNPSFSQTVPVHVPKQVQVASVTDHSADDKGLHAEPGDDRGGESATPTPSATSTSVPASNRGEDRGANLEPGDDRGMATEPGDDRGMATEPGDDHGHDATTSSTPSTTPSTTGSDTSGRGTVTSSSGQGGSDDGTAGSGSGKSGGHDDSPHAPGHH